MDEARGLDLNSRADHPEPSLADPVEAVATTPSAVAEADRVHAGDGDGGEVHSDEIGGQREDGGDLKMNMVEGRSLEYGEVVAGVPAHSGEVGDDDRPEKDGSCGDVEMVVDVRGGEAGSAAGDVVSRLGISDQVEQIEEEKERGLVEGGQPESVITDGVPCSSEIQKGDAFIGAEEGKHDGATEVQGSVEDFEGVKVDVEEIGKQEEVTEEGVRAASDVRGSDPTSVSDEGVIADEKRDVDVREVEALSTVENVVTLSDDKDSYAQVEFGMLDNKGTEVTVAQESTSYTEKSPDVATEAVVEGDRELEMADRSGGDEKMKLDTGNAPSSLETAGLDSLQGVTDVRICNQAEFVDAGASSVEKGERLVGDVPECDSEMEMRSRKSDNQGMELTAEQEVSMDDITEPPSVAPSVPKTDSVEVSADLGDMDEHHQEKKAVQGPGSNFLNPLVVAEKPAKEDMVGEQESVVLDVIDKNPDVQEVAHGSASEEEQKIEVVSSDNNSPITLTKESDMANLVVKVNEGNGGDQEAAINLVPLINKDLEVEEDAVLANEEVAKVVVSVPSDDSLSVPIMEDSVSANLVVEAHNRDSYPIGESVRDDPVSTEDSVSTRLSDNSIMDISVQTLVANSIAVDGAQGGAMPNVNSECSGCPVKSENRSANLVNENPDDGGDCSDANPCLLHEDMMQIDEPEPSVLSAVQSFTSQGKQCVDSPNVEKQEAKTTTASADDDDDLRNNPHEAVPSSFPLSNSVGLDASSGRVQILDTESMNHTANTSPGECTDVVQESEATAGLPFKGESELQDGSSVDVMDACIDGEADVLQSAFTDGDANFILTEGDQAVMNTDLCDSDTDKGQDKEDEVLERVDGVTVEETEISDMEDGQHARYYLASQDTTTVSVSDLVWGKVKSHPWWPGQIFDSSDASELAMKYQKKDNFLVAYFGDKTFAWCEESQLKPFLEYFSQMANQSTSDAFINALDDVLQEVSRRVQFGMTCQCTPEETYTDIKYQKIDNAGVRKGTSGKAFDRSQIVNSFQPDRLLLYIRALALFPKGETDRLDLVLALAQLNAFYLSKGYSQRPVLFLCGGLGENDDEVLPHAGEISEEQNAVEHHYGKNKLRGRKNAPDKQNALEDVGEQNVYELMEVDTSFQIVDGDGKKSSLEASGKSYSRFSGRKHKIDDFDPIELEKNKKERFDSLGDSKPKPSLIGSFKIGECIRRAASQLTGSTPVLKSPSEALQKSVSKGDHASFDVSVFDDSPDTPVETRRTKLRISDDNSSSSDMLSQLCLAARDPLKEYSFIPQIVNFFSDFRNSSVSDSSKDSEPVEKIVSKRGRKKKTDTQPSSVPASSETSAPDYMSDSYWSDMLFHSSPESNLSPNGIKRRGSYMRSQRKKRKSLLEAASSLQPDPMLGCAKQQAGNVGPNLKQELAAERPIIGLGRKHADDCTPTELILCFNKSDSMPSRTDLIRIFGRYGPLKESETEVMRKSNRVKVVFKRRADAEIAFSSAGKYSIFGPSLISYRLRYLPSIPEDPPEATPQDMQDELPDTTQQNTEDAPAEASLQNTKDTPPGVIPKDGKDGEDTDLCTTPDVPSNVIPQDAEYTPTETTEQDTNDAIPDITPDAPSEIMPQDAEDTPAETTQQDENETTAGTPADAPSESAPLDAEDTLPDATSDAAPNVTLQEVEHSLAETRQQDAEDVFPDATADVTLQVMEEDTPAETTQPYAEDALPDTTSVAHPDIMLQDGENEPGEITPPNAEDALPDATPDVTLQEVEDTHAETTQQDAEDALQDMISVAPPDIVLEVMEDTPAETAPPDAEDALPDAISSVTPVVTLQEVEDTPAGITQECAEVVLPDSTLDAPPDTVIEHMPAETMPRDAQVAPSDTVLQDVEDTPAETIPQHAPPDTVIEDMPAETIPQHVPRDAQVAPSDAVLQNVEDTPAEAIPQHAQVAPSDTVLQDVEDTPEGTIPQHAEVASSHIVLQDVEDTPAETIIHDAQDVPPSTASDPASNMVLHDVEHAHAEAAPQAAEDSLHDTTSDAAPDKINGMEDTPAETTPQDAEDETSDATPKIIVQDVEGTLTETKQQDAEVALPDPESDALPDTEHQDVEVSPGEASPHDAEDALPMKALENTTPKDSQGTVSETKLEDVKDASSKDSVEAEAELVVDTSQVEAMS